MNKIAVAKELVAVAEEIEAASRELTAVSQYGWVITRDLVDNPKSVRIFGPRGISSEFQVALNRGEGEKFELYDDDKVLYYEGRIVGDYDGFEPMDDYGQPNAGCTNIKLNGRWL